MASKTRPALVGRRFISLTGEQSPKLSRISDFNWRVGVIRAATSADPQEADLQVGVTHIAHVVRRMRGWGRGEGGEGRRSRSYVAR